MFSCREVLNEAILARFYVVSLLFTVQIGQKGTFKKSKFHQVPHSLPTKEVRGLELKHSSGCFLIWNLKFLLCWCFPSESFWEAWGVQHLAAVVRRPVLPDLFLAFTLEGFVQRADPGFWQGEQQELVSWTFCEWVWECYVSKFVFKFSWGLLCDHSQIHLLLLRRFSCEHSQNSSQINLQEIEYGWVLLYPNKPTFKLSKFWIKQAD